MSEAEPQSTVAKEAELHGVLPAGALLRSYEIISVLGQGSFGITYRARDKTLSRDVAIKEFLPIALALRKDSTAVVPRSTELAEQFVWGRERFLDEARTLATLDRATAVVRVFDFLEANGTAYIVMELVRGETLHHRIRSNGPLSPQAVEHVLHPLLDGLEQVHDVGFLHRDIKPSNIILDARDDPTLIDFGAARAAIAGRTAAMTAIFTPGYAAVEQFTSAQQGPWTDIYGLSATLYQAITGNTPPSAIDRMLEDAYRPLATLSLPGFSPALLACIDAGLAVRVKDRPQSIAEWRRILSMTAGDQATMISPLPPAASPTPAERSKPAADREVSTGRKRTGLWAAATIAGLVVAAGAGYLAFVPWSSSPTVVDVQTLKAEDLERLLAERRAAAAAAAEKKRLEEEAQRKAEADAAAKRQADADLEKAQQDRQKAEAELSKLKADMEVRRQAEAAGQQQLADAAARRSAEEAAQRKAEAEMAALRQTEQDAQRKAASEAEKKRQADEALAKAQAERQKADEEAAASRRAEQEAAVKRQAEADAKLQAEASAAAAVAEKEKADAAAKQQADAEAAKIAEKKAAEAAENGLRLAPTDRQRIQVALTSLGFDTRGSDGSFGPRSREMISAWQQKAGALATGFLSAAQRDQLLRSAAPAIARWDEEQKKIEDDKKKTEEDAKKKAEEETKARAAAVAPPAAPATLAPSPLAAPPSGGSYDGTYSGSVTPSFGTRPSADVWKLAVQITNGVGIGTISSATPRPCGSNQVSLKVSPSGDVTGEVAGSGAGSCTGIALSIRGRASDGKMQLTLNGPGASASPTLVRSGTR